MSSKLGPQSLGFPRSRSEGEPGRAESVYEKRESTLLGWSSEVLGLRKSSPRLNVPKDLRAARPFLLLHTTDLSLGPGVDTTTQKQSIDLQGGVQRLCVKHR